MAIESNRKRKRRSYSDDDRANALAALVANGGNLKRTAGQLGIPETSLRQWAKGQRHPESAQVSDQKRATVARELEVIAWKLIDAIPGKIVAAPLNHLMTAMGIAIDKMLLLQGRPTAITQSAVEFALSKLPDADLEAIAAIMDRAAKSA